LVDGLHPWILAEQHTLQQTSGLRGTRRRGRIAHDAALQIAAADVSPRCGPTQKILGDCGIFGADVRSPPES